MEKVNLWAINANVQVLTALVLITIFLMYIAFKLSQGKPPRTVRK